MNIAITLINNLFITVVQTSVTASILIVLILIFRHLLKGKLGVKFQYFLWFVIVLRLLIPKLPESSISIFNLFSKLNNYILLLFTSNKGEFVNNIDNNAINTIYNHATVLNSISSMNLNNIDVATFNFSITAFLALIWFVVMLSAFIYIFLINKRLTNKIQNHPEFYNKEATDIFMYCKTVMNIKKNILLIKTDIVKSPALFGVFKPTILLPKDLLSMISINELRYVFLHELAHFKRKDIIINWLISILRIVYWFNPIVQFGLKKINEDMEMCCDCLALSYTKDEEVKEYGVTMINLIEHFSKSKTILGATSMVKNKSIVRRRIIMIKLFNKKAYKLSAIALATLLAVGGVTLTNATVFADKKSKTVIVDNIDYPFVNDPQLIGKWESVDFVKNKEDFKVGTKSWDDDLYIKELNFTSDGKVSKTVFTWTKDHILNPVDKTDSSYEIKDIDGESYMFFQWKSGDYTSGRMDPFYYVLKKIDSTPSTTTNTSGEEVQIRTDKIDYPFVNDPEVLGMWQSVDFVENIDSFNPDVQSWKGDLYLNNLTFKEDGKVDYKNLTWTKDLVINPNLKTASSYTIKEIGEIKYLFFQWKNGDYVERGATPWYYVLKQVK
ncbi:MAG: M56 family metallopeptidase [Clostridiaceae bacterium]